MAAADNFFTKADQALKKKNFDYAIELYQQGLQIDADRMEERKRLRQAQIARIMTNGGSTTRVERESNTAHDGGGQGAGHQL